MRRLRFLLAPLPARLLVLFSCAFVYCLNAAAQAPLILIETSLPQATYATFALAKDSSSFALDSPENQALLDKGFGRPLTVQQVLDRHVLLTSPATKLLIPAPFGWRGFDDGKRTRLFTPTGNIGLIVSAMSIEGFTGWDDAREQVLRAARESAEKRAKADPRYQARVIRLADGTFGMREMNMQDSEGPHSSVTVFKRHPGDPKLAVRINLYAPVDDFERYLGLLGLVVRDVQVSKR